MFRNRFAQLLPALTSLIFAGALLVAISILVWSVGVGQAAGTTFLVTDPGDSADGTCDSHCSLREAVIAANANQDLNTIILTETVYAIGITGGGEDQAQNGDFDISAPLIIQGAGAGLSVIDGAALDRVFDVLATGELSISGVTIRNGGSNPDGGAIHSDGTLTVTHSVIEDNNSNRGGGILSHGSLFVQDTTFSGNSASSGGAIYQSGGSAEIDSSTFMGNTADSDGGALFSVEGNMLVTNSTLSSNLGAKSGGALATGTGSGPFVQMVNSTLAYNDSPKGSNIRVWRGEVRLLNSILAHSLGDGNCSVHGKADLISDGYNFSDDNSCDSYFLAAGDFSDVYPPQNDPSAPPLLDSLADNGGETLTHRLPDGSPAINAGTDVGAPAVDQRGVARPQSLLYDIGSFERILAQTGPIFYVLSADDIDDGVCDFVHCSLREAILASQINDNGTATEEIHFAIPLTGPQSINISSTLPALTEPLVISGTTQTILLDGTTTATNILIINGDNSSVVGLEITGATGAGIVVDGNGNTIYGNDIHDNGGEGVLVLSGGGNSISDNLIYSNGSLGIDLNGDGVTPNDIGDLDTGANGSLNTPFIARTVLSTTGTLLQGTFVSEPITKSYTLEFYGSTSCGIADRGQAEYPLGSTTVTLTQSDPDVVFNYFVSGFMSENSFVTAIATDENDNSSEFSRCISVGRGNEAWPLSYHLPSTGIVNEFAATHFLDVPGQALWYSFDVNPGEQALIELSNLKANYDVVVYKDIGASYAALTEPADNAGLARLNAEFAGLDFDSNPDEFRIPRAFSLDFLAGDFLAGDFLAGDFLAGDFLAGDFLAGDFLAGDFLAGDFLAGDFLAGDLSQVYSLAQNNSVAAVSASNGQSDESARVNTWNNSGKYYVRVSGRNGAYSLNQPFNLKVTKIPGQCGSLSQTQTALNWNMSASGPNANPAILYDYVQNGTNNAGNAIKTVIVTDLARMSYSGTVDQAALENSLQSLAAMDSVAGVVVDLSQVPLVSSLNAQADGAAQCPYAKNLVAYAAKNIIDHYRPDLEYVVIGGNDNVVPYFRHKDGSLLANERDFVPPVDGFSASEASLRLGYVLSQDRYGAEIQLAKGDHTVPLMDAGVGRLVENSQEIAGMIAAYQATDPATGGTPLMPSTGLATYYDFLADVGVRVADELKLGLDPNDLRADAVSVLGAPAGISPTDPLSWSADDMRQELLETRSNDLVFLAGHFSAFSALAADYDTVLSTDDVIASPLDLTNDVIFSTGCHSAYNTVDEHGVPGVTRQPDWPQAFARMKATLVGGTGYQYGDTELIELSERLYLRFSEQLRAPGPVPIGQALLKAKHAYLEEVPELSGIFEKSLIQVTLFGLPMMTVDLPGTDFIDPPDPSIVTSVTPATSPNNLTLQYTDVTINHPISSWNWVTRPLTTTAGGIETGLVASYLNGPDGATTNPGEPFLPIARPNVSLTGTVLRGVGFVEGSFVDYADEIPLTSAVVTELGVPHVSFLASQFFPGQITSINYFGTLTDPAAGATRLNATLAQYRSNPVGDTIPISGTLRAYEDVTLRLFYSNEKGPAALTAPPSVVNVETNVMPAPSGSGEQVTIKATVVAHPGTGVHSVWSSYYEDKECDVPRAAGSTGGCANRSWYSLDLVQDTQDGRLWTGVIDLTGTGIQAADLRLVFQAASWAGLVVRADNFGAGYTPGQDPGFSGGDPTTISLDSSPTSGAFGDQITVKATLQSTTALAGKPLTFVLGNDAVTANTDGNGQATAKIGLFTLPGKTDLRVYFSGDPINDASSIVQPDFLIIKQSTMLSLTVPTTSVQSGVDSGVVATLEDVTGRRLREKSVLFVVDDPADALPPYSISTITQWQGLARLGPVPLPAGSYQVMATFGTTATVGSEVLPLQDEAFHGAVDMGTLVIEPFNASVTVNVSSIEIPVNATVQITVSVGTAGSGSDVTLAQVLYELLDADGNVVSSQLGTVDSNGISTVFIQAPASGGTYTLRITVTGGYFTGGPVTSVVIVNESPAAVDDNYIVDEDNSLNVAAPGVLGNDIDVNLDPLTATLVADVAVGTLMLNADGSFDYTPALNFHGDVTFSYEASDGYPGNQADLATVTITVNPVNDTPVANDDVGSTDEDTAFTTVNVLANDTDVDGSDILAILGLNTSGTIGLVTDNGDGTFDYDPNGQFEDLAAGESATDSFDYTMSDGNGGSDSATVTITINGGNDAPVAVSDSYSTAEDTQLLVAGPGVLGNDSDVDGDTLTAVRVAGPSHGTLTLNSNGGFDYAPAANYFGTDSFTYRAMDGSTTSNLTTVTITVTPVNDAPDCSNAQASDTTIWPLNKEFKAVNVLGVTDIDGDSVTITITGIWQDEEVGQNDPYDAYGVGTDTAWVRAERDGNGDGRVYHIFFTADDGNGGICTDEVLAATVSHDQGDLSAIDGGSLYDSTLPG